MNLRKKNSKKNKEILLIEKAYSEVADDEVAKLKQKLIKMEWSN